MGNPDEKIERGIKNFTVENGIYKGELRNDFNKYKSLGEIIWTKIKRNGNKIAHLDACTEETVIYAELQDKVVRCALWMQKQGIKSGDIISVCTGNHLNSIVPCLSATYINTIFNTWNENMDLNSALYVLQMVTPKMIFCSEKCVDVILGAMRKKNFSLSIVVFGKHVDAISFSDILKDSNDAEVANFRYAELDDVMKTACILPSSGTTGMPKGVELSNYALLNVIQYNFLDMTNQPTLWFTPLYWLSGIIMNLIAIVQSSRIILYPEFNEEMTCQLIDKYKVGVIFFSTSMINRFLKSGYLKKYSLLSLKAILFGGAVIKPKVQEELRYILPHVNLLQGYGLTEITGPGTIQLQHHKNGSSGTVANNVQIKIVDPENDKVLGPNQSGEIWIKTKVMMNGYYRNPEATKSTIDEEGWLHSGDIGYVDEDGELFVIDRIKDLIKYKGEHISPGEVENVLMSHPEVLEAAVLGVPHTLDNEHPLAYVTKKPGAQVTEQELIDYVAKNMMDHYKLRAGVIFLKSFPYTGSGKIAKKDLKDMTKKLINYNND